MIQELLPLLPDRIGTAGLAIAAGGAAVGLALWLAGARFSRSLLALVATVSGGAIGVYLPRWFGWPIDPMATAVAGALVLGVVGFMAHGVLAGLGLGTVLSVWAALMIFALCGVGTNWYWPAPAPHTTLPAYLMDLYHSLPHDAARLLPFACAVALICGGAVAILWHRFGVVLLWSMTGLTLTLGLGIAAARASKPETLRVIPTQAWAQALVLMGLVAFGAVLQWNLAPAKVVEAKEMPTPQPKAKPISPPKVRRVIVDD